MSSYGWWILSAWVLWTLSLLLTCTLPVKRAAWAMVPSPVIAIYGCLPAIAMLHPGLIRVAIMCTITALFGMTPFAILVWRQHHQFTSAKERIAVKVEDIDGKVDSFDQEMIELRNTLVKIFESCDKLPPEEYLPILRRTPGTFTDGDDVQG